MENLSFFLFFFVIYLACLFLQERTQKKASHLFVSESENLPQYAHFIYNNNSE